MKIIASSLIISLLAVQVSEANAVVCARGVDVISHHDLRRLVNEYELV
jgi:hypothetical protein